MAFKWTSFMAGSCKSNGSLTWYPDPKHSTYCTSFGSSPQVSYKSVTMFVIARAEGVRMFPDRGPMEPLVAPRTVA